MTRMAVRVVIVAALVLLASGAASATVVYWTPAHELAPQGWDMSFITWGDLDADGDDDIARSSDLVWWNDGGCPGPPFWRVEQHVLPETPGGCVYRKDTLGDLDADGDLDLVSGCFQQMMYMHWNVGTPQVPQWQYDPSMFSGGANYTVPFLADLDGDGDLDLVMVTGSAAAFFWRNIGTPQAPIWDTTAQFIPPILLGPPAAIAVADLDGDADLDIIGITDDTPLQCWENVGTPQGWSFVENPAMLTGVNELGSGGWGIAMPDVDCDGDPDLLVAGDDRVRLLYLNESTTSVTPTSWGTIKALYR